jgi:hypothetical protein
MSKNLPSHQLQRTYALPPRWRWLTLTMLVVGGGSTTAIVLMQEEIPVLETCGPLAAIPLLGAPVLWLVRTIFNQAALPPDRKP